MSGSEATSRSEDPQRTLVGLGRGGALNIISAICQQASMLGVITVLARWQGRDDLGAYVTSYAILVLTSLIATVGLRVTVTRFVTVHLSQQDHAGVRGVIRTAVLTGGGVSAGCAVLVALAATHIASGMHEPGLTLGLLVIAATVPAFTLRDILLAATQGWRTQKPFALVGWVLEPVLRLVLTVLFLAAGAGMAGAYVAVGIAAWVAVAASALSLRRLLRGVPQGRRPVDRGEIVRFSLASWGNSISAVGLIWADTLFLAALGSTADVGVYQVATRIVSVAIFVEAPIDAVFAPYFARLFHRQKHDALRRVYTSAATWTMRLSLPAFVILIVFPVPLLGLFGAGFSEGALVTVCLSVGQLIFATTGPAGSVLNMSGRVRLNMIDNVASLVLNVALNLALIPSMGMLGAALAWSASLALTDLVKVLQIWHFLGMQPYGAGMLRATAAAVAGALVAVAVRLGIGDGLVALLVAVICSSAAYLLVTWWLRLTPDETTTLRGLARARAS